MRCVVFLAVAAIGIALPPGSLSRRSLLPAPEPAIVFARISQADASSRLYAVSLSGGDQHALWEGTTNDSAPRWSPDGTQIAFSRSPANNDIGIYVGDVAGVDLHRLTSSNLLATTPDWAPDGSRLAFTAAPSEAGVDANFDIYTVRSDRTGLLRLTTGASTDAFPSWAPDGKSLVYSRYTSPAKADLFVIQADGSAPRRLTKTEHAFYPAWSPREKRIAFVGGTKGHADLYTIASGGGKATRLARTKLDEATPAWSPDGSKIVFTRLGSSGETGNLYLSTATVSGVRRITRGPTLDVSAGWNPAAVSRRMCAGSG